MERLGDKPLAHLGSVGVGGIDERDAELDGPTQYGDRLAVVARFAPDPPARDPHSAEAEAVHLRSEEHTSELQSPCNLVCRLLLEKKKKKRSKNLMAPLANNTRCV